MKRVVSAYGVTAVVVVAMLGVIGVSPPDNSSADLAAALSSTSTSLADDRRATDADSDGLGDGEDPCPGDQRNSCFGEVAIDGITGDPIRINAGPHPSLACAGTLLDCNGEQWLTDFGYAESGALAGCPYKQSKDQGCRIEAVEEFFGCFDSASEQIFRCGHRPKRGGHPIRYEFAVASGRYLVNLYFAAAGPRAPDRDGATGVTIVVNGATVASLFDPADVAATNAVTVRSAVTAVEEGALEIELLGVRRRTALRALEVLAQAEPSDADVDEEVSRTDALAAMVRDGDNDGITDSADPCPTDARNRCVGAIAVDTATAKPIRLNANVSSAECSGAKTDCAGNAWLADFGYNQAAAASTCDLGGGGEGCVIDGIEELFGCNSEATEDLFQCDHYDPAPQPELKYSFSVPNGRYAVNLFFANTANATRTKKSRQFDIVVEGVTVFDNFDQIATAGGSGTAVVRAAVANITDGNGLQIELRHGKSDPAIKAIEVYAFAPAFCTAASQCDDDNPCTNDGCNNLRCTHSNNSGGCEDDGNVCTADVCSGGFCAHPATSSTCASDNNPCTNDVCSNGACTHPATSGGTCASDNNPCTSDVCSNGACTHPATSGTCTSDNNPCTNDVCSGGVCTHPATSGGTCTSDNNACTNDVCSNGACTHPAISGTCTSDNNPCTNDVCSNGACTHPAISGACPNDGNACTNDVCNNGVCTHPNNTAACDDGLACTGNDHCSGGVCGGTSNCPAGQTCNSTTGTCGGSSSTISFGKSTLSGASLAKPTSLQFGPDGKLYVLQQNGVIKIFTVKRNAANDYSVSGTQSITSIQSIPNHNDNGTLNSSVTGRVATGLLVIGTATNPVIYVTSSDPRIGGGTDSNDTNLDTNSGIISRLTWNGSSWSKLDLVRGLPRSEENHAANGMAYNASTNTLYVAQGGNTNKGATSNNFVYLPEYAYSAAILSVNLTAIGNTTYDLPTLNDENRSGNPDANDPFGGNSGKNQAKIVSGGPVQVFSPGWRNPYDVVITQLGKMYSIDNGANAGWGDVPVGNNTANCTNGAKEPGNSDADNLHLIPGQGYYAGHPNPTRGNINNKFNSSNPQSPVLASNSVECSYKEPGVSDGAMLTFSPSTNGLAEYKASNFGGKMKGDLIAAAWNNNIFRIDLNSTGTAVNSLTTLFSNVSATSKPLDLTTQGDSGPFPGTVWAAIYDGSAIVVYEPDDSVTCAGQDSPTLDDDGDGFDNADEIDNGTNPCSAGDVPPDADGDTTSNLNDPDDDNDGALDNNDRFARDNRNGKTTNLPVVYSWENGDPNPGGILNLGFKGLMMNGTSDYEDLFNPDDVTASGAAGVFTVDMVPEGDAYQSLNTQQYGFQFGINVTPASGVFTVHTRIVAPFSGTTPQDFQSMGVFLGTGHQDMHLKLTTSANGGAGGVQVTKEVSNAVTAGPLVSVAMPGPDAVDLYLVVNPATAMVQSLYKVTSGGVTGPLQAVGSAVAVPSWWFTNADFGLAVGIISTSRGAAPPFAATWDFIEAVAGEPS